MLADGKTITLSIPKFRVAMTKAQGNGAVSFTEKFYLSFPGTIVA